MSVKADKKALSLTSGSEANQSTSIPYIFLEKA
jgi:hypothetical protein